MSLTNTRGDAVQVFLTGAGSDGGSQADPDAALGNYRSGTRALGRGFLLSQPIANVRVDFVSGANGVGNGSLSAIDEDYLAWSAPEGTLGSRVRILNGESRIIEDGGDPGQFVQVTRTSAAALRGSCTVQITETLNDVLGQLNKETGAGKTYRCLCFRAASSLIQDLKIWIPASDHTVKIASEDPSAQPDGFFQTIADEETAPTGVSFVAPDAEDHADVITIATLRPGYLAGLWIERDIPALTPATAWAATELAWSFRAIG